MTRVEARRRRRRRQRQGIRRAAAWTVLFAVELLAAGLQAAVAAAILVPVAYRLRGYSAVGGEWLLIGILFTFYHSLGYFLAPYLQGAGVKGQTAAQAIRISMRLMDGKRKEILLLRFSFVPWFLLSALVIPLGVVYPYFQTVQAFFAARYIREKREQIYADRKEMSARTIAVPAVSVRVR